MAGSRLFGGKLPMNFSSPQVLRTVFKPWSPITSWAEVSAWRTSELMIIESFRAVIDTPIPTNKQARHKYKQGIVRLCEQIPYSDTGSMKQYYHFVY